MANDPGNFPEDHIESGVRIDAAAARRPTACTARTPADGWEHGLTEAVGGRLTAYILCRPHNDMINPEELRLARLDNSARLDGRETRRLVKAALGFDAISFEGEDDDGY